jgi:hypothetical protein
MKTKDRKTQCPNKNRLLGLHFRHLRRIERYFAGNCCFCTTVCQIQAVFRGFPRAPRSERSATCFPRAGSNGRSERSAVPCFWGPRLLSRPLRQYGKRPPVVMLGAGAEEGTRTPKTGVCCGSRSARRERASFCGMHSLWVTSRYGHGGVLPWALGLRASCSPYR